MNHYLRSPLVAFCCVLALTSCDEDGTADSGPPDTGPAPSCDALAPFVLGTDGSADPLAVPAGEARAGRLSAAELPVDRTGLAVWEEGDFVLANERVALLIEDVGVSDLYDPFGGRPVGVARVEGGALVEPGDFNEVIWGFGGFLIATESVTVINDGSDGGTAIIRAAGPLAAVDFVGSLISDLLGGEDFSGLPAAMDYELAPGADAVEIFMSVQRNEPRAARVTFMLTGIFQRFRMPAWTEEGGFGIPAATPMLAFMDDLGTSYGLIAPEGRELAQLIDIAGVLVFQAGGRVVDGCEERRIPLGSMVIGGPGLGGFQEALARRRGDTTRTVTGTITDADGSPAPDARVHVRTADGTHHARLLPAADGTFSVDVPNEAVTFYGHRLGTAVVGPIDVPVASSDVTITLAAEGTFRVTVTDMVSGEAIPARVQVLPVGGAPEVPADFGERGLLSGRAHIAFVAGDPIDLPVDPGMHDIIVSRGFEYEIETRRVMIAVDETLDAAFVLERVVDSTNIMCADYHIHTQRSPDSPDSGELKLRGLIGDGLEIAIRSDHEWVNDFEPEIQALGLSQWARGVGGMELTTFAFGHFGVFPLVEDRALRSGGNIAWVGRLPPAVFAEVRARSEAPALIINHPRSGGALGGYFNAAGFNRIDGTVVNADHWDEAFTIVEVFNNDSFVGAFDNEVADWFALLMSGRQVFAVGSSDSHNYLGAPVGYPRTCLDFGTDDPRAITPEQVRDLTVAGASVISGGILLSVSGPGGVGPGETATGVGPTAPFDVIVQAASWIDGVADIEVYVDGALHETIPILATDRDPMNAAVRIRAMGLTVPVDAAGSWVVFHARSTGDLSPLHPGKSAFGVSNPVFLER